VEPLELEFWQGGENRLHDRFRYRRNPQTATEGETPEQGAAGAVDWIIERLAP
jgi:pyridoxamine 5'-phosphate oxidase